MIEISQEQWRWLVILGLGGLVLLVAMFVYCVRSARFAYFGERWVRSAGSFKRAAIELRTFEERTDELLVMHACRFPPGALVRVDRETIEELIHQADRASRARDIGGGPGL